MKNLFAIVLVAGSFGIFYVIMAPTYEVIKTSLAEKAGYNKALNNSAAVTERQAVLGSKYNEMAPADVARLEKLLAKIKEAKQLHVEAQADLFALENVHSAERAVAGRLHAGSH